MLNQLRRGEGPPLVLLHGLGGSIANWEPVMDLVAAEREVIAVDLPGFGRSAAFEPPRRHSAGELAGAVAEHCEEIGVDRPHVAGNSLGAWVALELAADGGAESVCGISPAGLWSRPLGPSTSSPRRLGKLLRPLVLASLGTARGRAAALATTVAHPERVGAREARRWVANWLDAPGYEDANERMRALTFDRRDDVDVPVTIAWGARDRLVREPRRERMPPHARYLVAEDWGHTPTRDDPEGVARLLLAASGPDGRNEEPHKIGAGER